MFWGYDNFENSNESCQHLAYCWSRLNIMQESLRLEVKLIPYILLEATGMQMSKSLSSCTKISRLPEKTSFLYIKTKHSHTLLFDRELIHFVPLDIFFVVAYEHPLSSTRFLKKWSEDYARFQHFDKATTITSNAYFEVLAFGFITREWSASNLAVWCNATSQHFTHKCLEPNTWSGA